jgi:Ca-activated chloride channel family protein
VIGHDDWRLTAYALGEAEALDAADRAEVESLLASDADARTLVDEIRRDASAVAAEIATEAPPRLAAEQRASILMAASRGTTPAPAPHSAWRSWLPFTAAATALLSLGAIAMHPRERATQCVHCESRILTRQFFPVRTQYEWARVGEKSLGDLSGYALPRVRRAHGLIGLDDVTNGLEDPSRRINVVDAGPVRGRAGAFLVLPGKGSEDGCLQTGSGPAYHLFWGATEQSELAEGEVASAESYDAITENDFLASVDHPLSTFSIDVDTASYANVRRMLNAGQVPPPGAVRLEEFVNYFPYAYEPPSGAHPFAVHLEVAACPWDLKHRLVRIGLKGREVPKAERPASNLVFLLDVSGSMDQENKLPLVKSSMKLLLGELNARDRVAIVTYAGASGLALPSTTCDKSAEIAGAIDVLQPGGSTNGAAGIELAYQIAKENFVRGGTNRVILCTDGDFNVGVTDQSQLVPLVESKAKDGVFLSVFGFGMGNLKDATLEKLADKGNGNYGYIDDEKEARKALVEQAGGTLVTIAKDVKVQVEFNPAQVAAYRLVGYENRLLASQDFNDDKKDAGEIGAGHTVTALYELVPAGQTAATSTVDPLKYQIASRLSDEAASGEALTVKLRYKQPDGDVSTKFETTIKDFGASYDKASGDFKFAASVVSFALLLRHSQYVGTANLDTTLELANEGLGDDRGGYRREFVGLVQKAKEIFAAQAKAAEQAGSATPPK